MSVNWRVKAVLQGVFSASPGGHHLNYLFQKHVTHAWPRSGEQLEEMLARAEQYLEALQRLTGARPENAQFYEFGAGAELGMQLALYCLGVNHQTVVDIRPLARLSLVSSTARGLQALSPNHRMARGSEEPHGTALTGQLDTLYGIKYLAPCDARDTGLPAASFSCITSTNTMEHIPGPDLREILVECRRLIASDGVLISQIDYQDHYSYFDSNVSVYNYMRYPASRWRWYNPALHYQNRLRHSDYRRAITEAGWHILEEVIQGGSPDDLAAVNAMDLSTDFRGYAPEDLAIRSAVIVARPDRD